MRRHHVMMVVVTVVMVPVMMMLTRAVGCESCHAHGGGQGSDQGDQNALRGVHDVSPFGMRLTYASITHCGKAGLTLMSVEKRNKALQESKPSAEHIT